MLLPRLRMHFAEFLYANSSVRLRILSSPTCVGLRYGPPRPGLRDCFQAPGARRFGPPWGPWPSPLGLARGICLARSRRPRIRLGGEQPSLRRRLPCASSHRNRRGYGNVDPFPIGYDLRPLLRGRLTLGQITFTQETLGFRRTGIPPVFPLLMPASSLASRPGRLPAPLRPYMRCSLTRTEDRFLLRRSFGHTLSPATLSTRCYSTSELLRTL